MLLNLALAALTGIFLTAIHPRWDLTLLAPFAIAPLVYALKREWVPKYRFLLGYIAGLLFWASVNHWIHFVISVHGKLGEGLGAIGFLMFVLLRAIPLGFFGLLGGVLIQRRLAVITIPALWVAIERLPWLFNYTWLHLGNAGIDMSLPMRLAPVTGVYGLSYVFAMLGTAVALVALSRPRRELLPVTALLVLPVLPPLPIPEKPGLSAVAVQPNIPERDDWTEAQARTTQRAMERMSAESVFAPGQPRSDLILWPEVPAPLYYFTDTPFRENVNNLARLTRTPVLIGTVAQDRAGAPLNSALLISPAGEPSGRYDKMFPVPFGEYIPFPFKGILGTIASEAGDFEAGTRVVIFDASAARVGAFICYESAFPSLVRRFTAAGATVLANLSNDGYFGGASAREQHLSLVRMRAAENRRWILRATNDGITASVDPAGRIVENLPPYRELAGRLPFSIRSDHTAYVKFGDVFAWGCLGIAAVALTVSQLPSYRR